MRHLVLLAPIVFLASCASLQSEGKKLGVIRGRAIIQFEQQEFFECGKAGRVLTISNPEVFRKADLEAHPDDLYYVVEGYITKPGAFGSLGLTEGVLVAKNVKAMTGARLACLDTMQGR